MNPYNVDPVYRERIGAERMGAGTILSLILGALFVMGATLWALSGPHAWSAADTTTPSTVGQGSSRIDLGFPQTEFPPAPITGTAIKFESSNTEAVKTYTLEKKEQ
jgi:hypothetical protein